MIYGTGIDNNDNNDNRWWCIQRLGFVCGKMYRIAWCVYGTAAAGAEGYHDEAPGFQRSRGILG